MDSRTPSITHGPIRWQNDSPRPAGGMPIRMPIDFLRSDVHGVGILAKLTFGGRRDRAGLLPFFGHLFPRFCGVGTVYFAHFGAEFYILSLFFRCLSKVLKIQLKTARFQLHSLEVQIA